VGVEHDRAVRADFFAGLLDDLDHAVDVRRRARMFVMPCGGTLTALGVW